MKALTICQPYASLIIRGDKRIENRTWAPPASLIGERIAIHAGKSLQYMVIIGDGQARREACFNLLMSDLPLGSIIGTARLAGWVSGRRHEDGGFGWNWERSEPKERLREFAGWVPTHAHTEGPICWVLEDVQPCEPIPCKGMQGLWNVPEEYASSLTLRGDYKP